MILYQQLNSMKISFFGAAQNVTGSKHIIESGGFRILLDCGLYQGKRAEADKLNRQLGFDPKMIDAVILSHAHADHSGLLPVLVKQGFRGKIYCTDATADIVKYILLDSAKIQQQDCRYCNTHLNPGEGKRQPLYKTIDAQKVFPLLAPVPYFRLSNAWTALNKNIRFKLIDAGHILGSAITVLEINEAGQIKKLAYTGDLGQCCVPILHPPETIPGQTQTLIMEATYGNRVHAPVAEVTQKLIDIIQAAVAKKSKIMVPAFSLGRTQEIVYILHKLTDQKLIPRIPVYIDSPLSNKISGVFKGHEHDFNETAWKDFGSRNESSLAFRNLHYVNTIEDSKKLDAQSGPFMIISASGMMEGGRILHHLKNSISDPNNVVIITGYQAVRTLGRKIQEGASSVKIFNQMFAVRAKIVTINEFSAHADKQRLLDYVSTVQGLKNLFLVHTELPQAASLKLAVQSGYPNLKVEIPAIGQNFII